jgi:hypothetical protein
MRISDDRITSAVERALEIILKRGVDDVFVPPNFCLAPELSYIRDEGLRNSVLKHSKGFLQSLKVREFRPIVKFGIPKNAYAYRHAALVDLVDVVKFMALILLIAEKIEDARIDRAKNVVFSYRFNKRGDVFSQKFNYKAFLEESARRSRLKYNRVKIATDIANFYDRLNLHRLESILADIGVDPQIVKVVNDLLIYWAGRNSYGLPVGGDASRILAEASLIGVDNFLLTKKINFVRFVDDYRIFAGSYAEAHSHLHNLIEALDREGLFLNTSKTVFFDIDEVEHEEIDESAKPALLEFDAIDEAESIVTKKSVKVGYVSRIVKSYRYPGKEKIEALQRNNLAELLSIMNSIPFERAEDKIREFVQSFIYQGGVGVDFLVQLVERYIHSLTYVVDALIKESDRIPSTQRLAIRDACVEYYARNSLSPYYRLIILRLIAHPSYLSESFLGRFLDDIKLDDSVVILREFCCRIRDVASRDLLNRLLKMYERNSTVVRRAIFEVYTSSEKILPGEKKAWVKNVNVSESDPYIKALAGRLLSKDSPVK